MKGIQVPEFICKNYGGCALADAREKFELLLGAEPVCPECTLKLIEAVDGENRILDGNRRLIVAGAIVALVLLVGLGYWFADSMSGKKISPDTRIAGPAPRGPGVLPDSEEQKKAKTEVDRTILESRGQGATALQNPVIAREYVKAAIPFLQAGKWQEAEAQLTKAKNENADEPLIYVNEAIIHLKLGREKDAIAALETAFKKGFKDFAAIDADIDLKPLTTKPEYGLMVAPFKAK